MDFFFFRLGGSWVSLLVKEEKPEQRENYQAQEICRGTKEWDKE